MPSLFDRRRNAFDGGAGAADAVRRSDIALQREQQPLERRHGHRGSGCLDEFARLVLRRRGRPTLTVFLIPTSIVMDLGFLP